MIETISITLTGFTAVWVLAAAAIGTIHVLRVLLMAPVMLDA